MSAPTEDPVIHILWINAGLSCDGDSVALTAEGTARFLGDVVVMGTLYAPTVVNAVPTSAEARQVAQRSARTAARIRAARSSGG